MNLYGKKYTPLSSRVPHNHSLHHFRFLLDQESHKFASVMLNLVERHFAVLTVRTVLIVLTVLAVLVLGV